MMNDVTSRCERVLPPGRTLLASGALALLLAAVLVLVGARGAEAQVGGSETSQEVTVNLTNYAYPDATAADVFDFVLDGEVLASLGDSETGSLTLPVTPEGDVEFFIDPAPGWTMTDFSCSNASGNRWHPVEGYLQLRGVNPNDTIECSVTSKPGQPVALNMVQQVVGGPANGEVFRFFFFSPDLCCGLGGSFQAGESVQVHVRSGIKISINQWATSDGWEFENVSCYGAEFLPGGSGSSRSFIVPENVAEITCTFVSRVEGSTPEVGLVTLAGRSDGWVQVGATRNWVSASCRSQLEAAGLVAEQIYWAQLVGLADAVPFQGCDALLAELFPPRVVTLAGRSDGWVQDGATRNWVSASCRSQLEAAGLATEEVSWAEVSALADAVPFQRCDALIADLFS